MSNRMRVLLLLCSIAGITAGMYCLQSAQNIDKEKLSVVRVSSMNDIKNLFPQDVSEIQQRMQKAMDDVLRVINTVIAVPNDRRSFSNTIKPLDNIDLMPFNVLGSAVVILEMVSPNEAIRVTAHEIAIKAQEFYVEHFTINKKLYSAVKIYAEGNAKKETLTEEQSYLLNEMLDDWRRAGLELPDDVLAEVKDIQKELATLTSEFDKNIADDTSNIIVSQEGLAGLSDNFISALKKAVDNHYILGVDYPTYYAVQEQCTVVDTRMRLYKAFTNRAYPKNEKLLQRIIAKRTELAQKLGFNSYAELDLDSQMVGSPKRARIFIDELRAKAKMKAEQELKALVQDLPDSVIPTDDGKLQPWDISFVTNAYKKKYFNIDEELISEYFPMKKTIEGLLDIYKQFFSINFKQISFDGLWHEEVQAIQVMDKNGTVLGYLLLDLYPRPFKYSHACQAGVIPAVYDEQNKTNTAVSVVLANFTRSTEEKPSLLQRREVTTFFHEFGHALHYILGRTSLVSQAGTKVKRDFVELPSQMLEEWLLDKGILKMVSCHYQTGQTLPDKLIDKIIAVKNFSIGNHVLGQLFYADLALTYFSEGPEVDLYQRMCQLHKRSIVNTTFDPDNHFYCNFGHLTGYGAKYYGYMWSKVFAKDLFAEINKHGLLNAEIGQHYVTTVIGRGGSKDPNELLKDFLGRAPTQDAFLSDLGLM